MSKGTRDLSRMSYRARECKLPLSFFLIFFWPARFYISRARYDIRDKPPRRGSGDALPRFPSSRRSAPFARPQRHCNGTAHQLPDHTGEQHMPWRPSNPIEPAFKLGATL